jgi:hypothetical protein
VKGRRFPLRRLLHQPEQLGGGRLVEARPVPQPEQAYGLEEPQRSQRVRVAGVFRLLERDGDMALRREVVDLIGLDLLDQPNEVGGVGHFAVVQEEAHAGLVRVPIEMVDPRRVEKRAAPAYAVNDVTLLQEQLCKVGAVLAGDAGDQRLFAVVDFVQGTRVVM